MPSCGGNASADPEGITGVVPRRVVSGRPPQRVDGLGIGPGAEQGVGDLGVTAAGGKHQGSDAMCVHRVDVRVPVQQQSRYGGVALVGRQVQCRRAELGIISVRIGPGIEQRLYQPVVGRRHRFEQETDAVLRPHVWTRSVPKQGPQPVHIALLDRATQVPVLTFTPEHGTPPSEVARRRAGRTPHDGLGCSFAAIVVTP